ncbi:MAG: lipoyl synthase [Armatimonadetes bacterium]|nr:lipoyl synthase [Armatimonadota bacterium]
MRLSIPDYLRRQIKINKEKFHQEKSLIIRDLLMDFSLNTVCKSAQCPNQGECFSNFTMTFMILGDICTRNCRFCAVNKGTPVSLYHEEFSKVIQLIKILNLKYVVITSVSRDDLPDGGAESFALLISKLRKIYPDLIIEVLIPDFLGDEKSLNLVINAKPDLIGHNMETVKSLYFKVRPSADYERSLNILKLIKEKKPEIYAKSGIMLGLGEEEEEIKILLNNLKSVDCDIVTLGQYLSPSIKHYPVKSYISKEKFKFWKDYTEKIGFKAVFSEALARSSYRAYKIYQKLKR